MSETRRTSSGTASSPALRGQDSCAPSRPPQRPHRPRHRRPPRPHRQAYRRRQHHRIPQRGRRRPLRDRGAERSHRTQRWAAARKCMEFRVGFHRQRPWGERRDLMGDGVSIAARLEGIAKPGAICLSAYWQVKGRLDLKVSDLGATRLKNIAEPVRVYSVEVGKPGARPKPSTTPRGRLFPVVAALATLIVMAAAAVWYLKAVKPAATILCLVGSFLSMALDLWTSSTRLFTGWQLNQVKVDYYSTQTSCWITPYAPYGRLGILFRWDHQSGSGTKHDRGLGVWLPKPRRHCPKGRLTSFNEWQFELRKFLFLFVPAF
jgi:hypothetical protein